MQSLHKGFLKTAALLGGLAVALGAFGAHGLKKVLDPAMLAVFETAVRYHFFHVFALFAAGLLFGYYPNKAIQTAGRLFTAGIGLFSGSLYLLVFSKAHGVPGLGWTVYVTPVGGSTLMIGWGFLFAGIKEK